MWRGCRNSLYDKWDKNCHQFVKMPVGLLEGKYLSYAKIRSWFLPRLLFLIRGERKKKCLDEESRLTVLQAHRPVEQPRSFDQAQEGWALSNHCQRQGSPGAQKKRPISQSREWAFFVLPLNSLSLLSGCFGSSLSFACRRNLFSRISFHPEL